MWALGAGANAGIGYMVDGSVDPENAIIAGWVNVITMGQGWKGTVGWNAAGGAFGNWIDGKDPLSGALINGAGSGIGYGIGKGLSWGVNAGANWWKGGWDPKFNAELRSVTEVKGDLGISKEMKPSKVPSLNRQVWSLADFRHHSAQFGRHKAPSDWRFHSMKYTPVGVDIAKYLFRFTSSMVTVSVQRGTSGHNLTNSTKWCPLNSSGNQIVRYAEKYDSRQT